MADLQAKQYLDVTGLGLYDQKIKEYLAAADAVVDAKSIKTVLVDGDNIKFYKKENATTADAADYIIAISSSDVAALKTKVGTATLDTTAKDLSGAVNELNTNIGKVASDLAILDGTIGDIPDGATATTVVGYAKEVADAASDAVAALDESLSAVAKSGAAADVTIADEGSKITATNVEGALQELATAISDATTAGAVTVEKSTDIEGVAARYTFKQGGTAIANAVIDIPKDMVVSSGTVEVDPKGQPAGTYLVLTLANATSDKVYINVGSLIEYVTGGDTAEIKVAVDATTHVVTATVDKIAASKIIYKVAEGENPEVTVAGAIADLEAAVGTGSVASQIQTEIEKLDADITSAAVTEGKGVQVQVVEADGKITNVAVTGNYDNSYDARGSANAVYAAMQSIPATSINALFNPQTPPSEG